MRRGIAISRNRECESLRQNGQGSSRPRVDKKLHKGGLGIQDHRREGRRTNLQGQSYVNNRDLPAA